MQHTIHLQLQVPTAVRPSPRVLQVAGMFGLGLDETRTQTLIPPTELTLAPRQVIFITGASGGGKTSLLRLIAQQASQHADLRVIHFDNLPDPPDAPLVDALDLPLADTLRLLSVAGLNDAFVMLRRPCELSDGQRYRFRLARTMAAVEADISGAMHVVLADEFGAALDRVTAQVIAANIRKWTRRAGTPPVCFIAATTHDDLLEALEPDVVIEKGPGSAIELAFGGNR